MILRGETVEVSLIDARYALKDHSRGNRDLKYFGKSRKRTDAVDSQVEKNVWVHARVYRTGRTGPPVPYLTTPVCDIYRAEPAGNFPVFICHQRVTLPVFD